MKEIIDNLDSILELDEIGFKSAILFIKGICKTDLLYEYGIEFTKFLLKILDKTKKCEDKIILMETIMLSIGIGGYSDEFYQDNLDINYLDFFFEYTNLLANSVQYTKNTNDVLNEFIDKGISLEIIINTILTKLKKENSVILLCELFSRIDVTTVIDNFNNPEIKKLLIDIERYSKNKKRILIIYQMLIITHPQYKNMFKYCGFTEWYSSYENIMIDWYWTKNNSSKILVNEGIISEKEGLLLEQIGKLIIENNTYENLELCKDKLKNIFEEFCCSDDIIEVLYKC